MSRFDLTPIAENDLMEIIRYIAEDSPDSAIRVKNQLQAACSRLAMAPGMGHFREELLDRRYKFWTAYSYLIVYRWEIKPIQIIAIVHGARDLEAFLARLPR